MPPHGDAISPGEVLGRLGSTLRAHSYDDAHLRLRLGRIPDRLTTATLATAERRTGDDQLGLLIRFWCLGLPAAGDEIEAILGGTESADLERSGLIVRTGSEVTAAVRISPAGDRLLVHDFDRAGRLSKEHVIGVSPATRTLAGLTPRNHVRRALDIGTGCGAQAIDLAAHAESVVATDISERAAWATRASAALNGIDHLEVRIGDGLAPVADEQFDLVVSNPPFVVSPAAEVTFRDAGTRGDAMSRSLVRDVVTHLRPAGVACVLVNWIVRAGESVTAAAETWLDDLPVKALLLQHEALAPAAYAQRWPLLPADVSIEEHRATTDRWLAELERLGARSVASGAVVMERTDGHGAVRVVKMPRRPADGGPQVRRMLDAMGRFSGPDDTALGSTRFRLVHGHRIDQRLHYGHGSYKAAPARMRMDQSAGVEVRVPPELLEAVFGFDAGSTIGDVTAEVAAGRGQPEAGLEAALRPLVLELYELGVLEALESRRET